jgi:integrase
MSTKGRKAKGSVKKRGTTFRARITIDGKAHTQSHATRQQAESWLHGMQHAVRDPEFADEIADARKLTLGQAMALYLASPKKKSSDPQKDKSRTDSIVRVAKTIKVMEFEKRPLFHYNVLHIQSYIDHRLEDDVSPSTINRELTFISRAFRFASVHLKCVGLINPVTQGIRLAEPMGRDRRLWPDERALLFECAQEYELTGEVPLRAFISFACDTAMRFGEIWRLKWEDIDWSGGVLMVRKSKNGSPRSIPMVDEVWTGQISVDSQLPLCA